MIARRNRLAVTGGDRLGAVALAGYQERRDRIALPMHPVVDRLAAHQWDPVEARRLLRGLSTLIAAEVDAILGLDPAPARTA